MDSKIDQLPREYETGRIIFPINEKKITGNRRIIGQISINKSV